MSYKGWMIHEVDRITRKHGRYSPEMTRFLGEALSILWQRQTIDEQVLWDSRHQNETGFSKPDAEAGSDAACYFRSTGSLMPRMVDEWLEDYRANSRTFVQPRICKYSSQLSEAAINASEPEEDSDPELDALLEMVSL